MTKTKRPYAVTFQSTVYVWAESEHEASDLACRYGADEAGFGEAFSKMCLVDAPERLDDEYVMAIEFINPEDEPELCVECGGPNDDGEGWDGMCGNCADRAEAERGEATDER